MPFAKLEFDYTNCLRYLIPPALFTLFGILTHASKLNYNKNCSLFCITNALLQLNARSEVPVHTLAISIHLSSCCAENRLRVVTNLLNIKSRQGFARHKLYSCAITAKYFLLLTQSAVMVALLNINALNTPLTLMSLGTVNLNGLEALQLPKWIVPH